MRKILMVLFIICNLIASCFATELWNGFTDEMTKHQVIMRANELFNAKPYENSEISYSDGIELFFDDKEKANHFLSIASVVHYSSPNKEFQYHIIGGNIRFYFIENTLYAVTVEWNSDITEQVSAKAKENYGSNFKIFDAHSGYVDSRPTLLWDFPDKEVYLNEWCQTTGAFPFAKLYVFSKNKMEKGNNLIKELELAKRKRQEKQKQNSINNIAF